MRENANRFVLNVPLEVVARAFGSGGGLGYYPGDDDDDIVDGPGGPRAFVFDLLRGLQRRQVSRAGLGGNPNPDSDDDFGPGWPVVRLLLEALSGRRFAFDQAVVRGGNGHGNNPNPDSDDDFGPGWPVVRIILEAVIARRLTLEQAATFLARSGPSVGSSLAAGPQPEPWRATLAARASIDRLVGLSQAAELGGGEESQKALGRQVAELVDDYCATPPRAQKCPLPWPFRLRGAGEKLNISPAELLAMGAQFYHAAEALGDTPLASDFAAAAHRLSQTGFDRLAEPARANATALAGEPAEQRA